MEAVVNGKTYNVVPIYHEGRIVQFNVISFPEETHYIHADYITPTGSCVEGIE